MPQRVFLGWSQPFLLAAVAWLLDRKADLPNLLIVVPTAQSGRRLRETLAEQGGALLSPKVVTPGSLLQIDSPDIAPDWIEQVAWAEVFENVRDWSAYEALFSEKPGEGSDWAAGLASDMVTLRRSLQENGLMFATAAWPLKETVESERWAALADLERLVEAKLQSWKLKSRSRALAEGLILPAVAEIVLAGVTEMPPLLERTLSEFPGKVTVLIGAPESAADQFSATGKPTDEWTKIPLAWPTGDHGSVKIVADPRQQAAEALQAVARGARPSDQIALGSADAETGDELLRAFTRAGWTAFHPAAVAVPTGLSRWFKVWRKWLAEPKLATLADLLSLPETYPLISGKRAQKAKQLAVLRDRWMILHTEDLERRLATTPLRTEWEQTAAEELLESARKLEALRNSLLAGDFTANLRRLLQQLARSGPTTRDSAFAMTAWLDDAAPMIARLDRSVDFWIDLMVSEIPAPAATPPAGRVIDIQGWLELFHEPGEHLVLCGLNEGKVPARGGGEPWLSEAIRDRLNLTKDEDRAARDAFLFHAMIEARRATGRVDLICGKAGSGGEAMLPSRLLLAGEKEQLPDRVRQLFRDIEPPEAGLRWEADWLWKTPTKTPPVRLNVTSLADYLRCPFRYYLKHVVNMGTPEPGRSEWNARDFGTVAHEVLERWGRDEEARESSKAAAIEKWLSNELDRVVAEWFGKRTPLAIRIQTEAMRQRLAWLARIQANERTAGWRVVRVERKIEIPVGAANIVAKIDRVDRNDHDGRLRVLDYKTGKVDGVEKSHRRKITANTNIPAHLGMDSPAVFDGEDKGKPAQFLWENLQLPLYALALVKGGDELPTPAYFTLSSTEGEVAIHEWNQFSTADLEAAQACADWVAGQIDQRVFWPPVEKVMYDDYRILTSGKSIEEMMLPPAAV
jgi:ATP-dependent helicase/nuclease subunit B